jgi:hypothetical protein
VEPDASTPLIAVKRSSMDRERIRGGVAGRLTVAARCLPKIRRVASLKLCER